MAFALTMQEGYLPDAGQVSSRMTDSTTSLTDITLEQAALKLQEIERENMALKENLRTHNAIVKKQYDALAEWRKKENDKFEQTKALITGLRADNQELQVKVMSLTDKEKELTLQVQSIEEEKARLQRQKAMSDQRLFNVYKLAEEQGVKGLVQEELGNAQDIPDIPLHVATAEKEEIVYKLETALAGKEEMIAQLRADVLKRDQEIVKSRETTKQLLKDMESQQKLKEAVEQENRLLTSQIMQTEQKLHKQMQAVMAVTKREMQAKRMFSAASSVTSSVNSGAAAPESTSDQQQEKFTEEDIALFSFPEKVDDLVGIAKSLEAKQQEELTSDRLMKTLEEERKSKETMKNHIDKLEQELQEMTIKQEEKEKELEEVQQRAVETADKLAQDYENKLTDMAKINNTKSIHASETEDISILRSQVLALLRDVDEAQNKLSAAIAALHHKDARILELEQLNQGVKKDFNDHWQETHAVIQNLQSQLVHHQKSQQENAYIKSQHVQLQHSFSVLVTDYKELQETFEVYRQQMEKQAAKQIRKDAMEEINRLTAQVIAAEEAIAQRDEQIVVLKHDAATNFQQDEEIQLLQIQAELFRNDFQAEREARNKLAEEKNTIAEENSRLQNQIHYLEEQNRIIVNEVEGYNQRQMHDMQRRFQMAPGNYDAPPAPHLRDTPPLAQDYRQPMQNYRQQADFRHQAQSHRVQDTTVNGPQIQASGANLVPGGLRDEEELPSFQDFECPSCGVHFPDVDSLQLHVPDCIDNNR